MAVGTAQSGVGAGFLSREISTEFGVTIFQLAVGTLGGAAALLAARRLERAEGTIPVSQLILPVAVAGTSTILGALLLPTGE